ncbi:MAG: N-acetylmuramoyl-L-alanine amidase [Eggerthellaceae bacterium]|nr:N-acetylmuramoyl-L-alanine amidase [Eggerthellaceae bacterium]
MKHVLTKIVACVAMAIFASLLCASVAYAQVPAPKNGNNYIVVIDPGHGGVDGGATKTFNAITLKEKTINLKIALSLQRKLMEFGGVEVYLTRASDINPTIDERVQIAADYNADLFISVHINSAVNGNGTSPTGFEIYVPQTGNYNAYTATFGYDIASGIQRYLSFTGLTNRGIKSKEISGEYFDGYYYPTGELADFYGIIRGARYAGITGMIVEHAFISTEADFNLLCDDSFLAELGYADALGIAEVLGLSLRSQVADQYQVTESYKSMTLNNAVLGSTTGNTIFTSWAASNNNTLANAASIRSFITSSTYQNHKQLDKLPVELAYSNCVYQFMKRIVGDPVMGRQDTSVIDLMIGLWNINGRTYPSEVYSTKGAPDIEAFCQIIYMVATSEGVRPDLVFCQAMKETGWLRFTGSVSVEQCNFAGMGASGNAGCVFSCVQEGLLAQVQHLKYYGSTEPLYNDNVDPRWNAVSTRWPRGCAPTIPDLSNRWSTTSNYGQAIVTMFDRLYAVNL